MTKFHFSHMVEVSPWPLLASVGGLGFVSSLLYLFDYHSGVFSFSVFPFLVLLGWSWWRDVSREGYHYGLHGSLVMGGLSFGMILFIVSEVLFFSSFFWAFFHGSICPVVELGQSWPPVGLVGFDPLNIPLLNTIILLSSGVSVTWSHHMFVGGSYAGAQTSLILTVLLGFYFTFLQGFEYLSSYFSIGDSCYGSIFFMGTGFHGIHVIIGSIFLSWYLARAFFSEGSGWHLLGFEFAAWYWHFVDVVWLFLYSVVYWWGSFLLNT